MAKYLCGAAKGSQHYDAISTSVVGHLLPINSAPVPNNVRYASDSDRILRRSKMTLSAMNGHRGQMG